jgi:hypothetical protein
MVRPWKLCSSARNFVPMHAFARSRPAWARASFSAASQASVPELQKKTRSRPADLGEAQGELGGVLVVEEVRGVEQALALFAMAASTAGCA